MIIYKNKLLVLWILALVFTIPLCVFDLFEYVLVTGIAFAFSFTLWLIAYIESKDENKIYKSNLKEILKTFDAVLIKVDEVPSIEKRDIIKVNSIEDLIDAQVEVRKPIFYYLDVNSCTFVLLDRREYCFFILRKNKDVVAVLDGMLREEEKKKQIRLEREKRELDNYDKDSKMLDGIENTTIIKFNNRSFVVSPIRDVEIPKEKKKK